MGFDHSIDKQRIIRNSTPIKNPLNVLAKGVRVAGVELLVSPHDGHQVFRFAQVDDVVGVARQHLYRLDVAAVHLKFQDFLGTDFPLLDQAVATDHHKELPLGVVPMLALCDARFGDVHRNLSAVSGFQKLGEAAPFVYVHLQREGPFLPGQVGQVGGIELFGEAVRGNLRQHQRLGLGLERFQQLHDFSQGHLVGGGNVAIFSHFAWNRLQSVVVTAMGMALQGVQKLFHQVIDVEQLQLGAGVVDLDGQVVGEVVAEGGHHAVVVGAAPLAEQVGEPVHQHGGAGLLPVSEKQLLPRQLGPAVIGLAVPADERSLDGAGEHHGAPIPCLLQGFQEGGRKAVVPGHELLVVLGAVDPSQMVHEIGSGAIVPQQGGVCIQVIFEDFLNVQAGPGAVLALCDVPQVGNQVLSHKALGAGD